MLKKYIFENYKSKHIKIKKFVKPVCDGGRLAAWLLANIISALCGPCHYSLEQTGRGETNQRPIHV